MMIVESLDRDLETSQRLWRQGALSVDERIHILNPTFSRCYISSDTGPQGRVLTRLRRPGNKVYCLIRHLLEWRPAIPLCKMST